MPEKLESASNFANKLWNAAKFVLLWGEPEEVKTENLSIEDKWIISKLNNIAKEITQNLDNFELGVATQKIYDFIWNEFCDWYIEMAKPRLYEENESKKAALYTLNKVLIGSLKLLHPIMPFITEEIYSKLYATTGSIMVSDWPEYKEELNFKNEEDQIEKLKDIVTGIRNVRTNMNVHPSKKSKLIFVTTKYEKMVLELDKIIKKLCYAEEIIIQKEKENIPQNSVSVLTDGIEVYIPFEDLVDIEAEKERLENERKRLVAEVERSNKMLSNQGFISKAPASKVEEEKAKLKKYEEMLKNVEERIQNIK